MDDDWGLRGGVSDSFGVSFIELLDKFVCVNIGCWFPAIMGFREPLPPDQVLDLMPVSSDT